MAGFDWKPIQRKIGIRLIISLLYSIVKHKAELGISVAEIISS